MAEYGPPIAPHWYHDEDGFDNDDDIIQDDDPGPADLKPLSQRADSAPALPLVKSPEELWAELPLDVQFRNVMEALDDGEQEGLEARWKAVEEWKKISLTATDRRDKQTPTLLHIMAKKFDDFKEFSVLTLQTVVKYLLDQQYGMDGVLVAHENSALEDQHGRTRSISPGVPTHSIPKEIPLLKVAMEFRKDDFIKLILDCWPKGFPHLLEQKDEDDMNCIHRIFDTTRIPLSVDPESQDIRKETRNLTKDRAPKFVPAARPAALAARDREGNTPIHYAMDAVQCRGRMDDYVELVKWMVLSADKVMRHNETNDRGESPFLYCKRTMKEERQRIQQEKERQERERQEREIKRQLQLRQQQQLQQLQQQQQQQRQQQRQQQQQQQPLDQSQLLTPSLGPVASVDVTPEQVQAKIFMRFQALKAKNTTPASSEELRKLIELMAGDITQQRRWYQEQQEQERWPQHQPAAQPQQQQQVLAAWSGWNASVGTIDPTAYPNAVQGVPKPLPFSFPRPGERDDATTARAAGGRDRSRSPEQTPRLRRQSTMTGTRSESSPAGSTAGAGGGLDAGSADARAMPPPPTPVVHNKPASVRGGGDELNEKQRYNMSQQHHQQQPQQQQQQQQQERRQLQQRQQALQSRQAPKDQEKGSRRQVSVSMNQLLEFLRVHYIRTRSDLVARELIYGRDTPPMNLYFDASGLHGLPATKITELIGRMSSSLGGFSDTLSYVYLPIVQRSNSSTDSAKPGVGTSGGTSATGTTGGGGPNPPKKSYQTRKPLNRAAAAGEESTRSAKKTNNPPNPNPGRDSLVCVFQKLYDVGVRKILRLIVEDRDSVPHSDTAIETALQGRDWLQSETSSNSNARPISIEVWDWKRPDLSADVICFAAPAAKTVNLYWGGNQMVLRGWASPKGIPQFLQSEEQSLEEIHLHATPGLESTERMERLVENFKTEIATLTGVKVKEHYHISGLQPTPSPHDEGADPTSARSGGHQQEWVITMEKFRLALISIHSDIYKSAAAAATNGTQVPAIPPPVPIERVRVALIDDGVDVSSLDMYNDVVQVTGQSFYPAAGESVERPWYISNNTHGTIMAKMILRINPWVELHALRLHDSQTAEGIRTIYADSAAKAIRGALALNVTIISISWSVKQKLGDGTGAGGGGGVGGVVGGAGGGRSNLVAGSNTLGIPGIPGLPGTQSAMTSPPLQSPSKDPITSQLSPEDLALNELRSAIDEAVSRGTLIFCSANDNQQTSTLDTLPYQRASNHAFRIGAASGYGDRDPKTEAPRKINYFFPGDQVAEHWNTRAVGSKSDKYHDGSSVATALAAGFASVIIYSAILLREHYSIHRATWRESWEDFGYLSDALRQRENMRKAFDTIGVEDGDWEENNKKFLPVWSVFGPATANMSENKGSRKWEELDRLVRLLTRQIPPRPRQGAMKPESP